MDVAALLVDRFVALEGARAWDLATGDTVRFMVGAPAAMSSGKRGHVRIDWGPTPDDRWFEASVRDVAPADSSAPRLPAALIEALDHGAEGEPRALVIESDSPAGVETLRRGVAREARLRGYVPLSTALLPVLDPWLCALLRARAIVLLHQGPEAAGAALLTRLASWSPRPHLLVTLEAPASTSWVVREAQGAYASSTTPGFEPARRAAGGDRPASIPAVTEARVLVHRGRHAAAERLLRERAAAAARRARWCETVDLGVVLGRLLLTRGRPGAAARALDGSLGAGERSGDRDRLRDLRVWLAVAHMEAGRPTAAESLLRALHMGDEAVDPWRSNWSRAMLARCLLDERRPADALVVLDGWLDAAVDPGLLNDVSFDAAVVAAAVDARTEVLLAAGRVREAGGAAEWALRTRELQGDAAHLRARLSFLRVAASAGCVDLARASQETAVRLARRVREPVLALATRAIWNGLLMDLRQEGAGRRAVSLQRMQARLPPGWRRPVPETAGAAPDGERVASPSIDTPLVEGLLQITDEEVDDVPALNAVAAVLARALRASRVVFVAGPTRPPAVLGGEGGGVTPAAATRVLDAGIVIGPEIVDGAYEAAVPVRSRGETCAALAARWPIGRTPAPAAAAALRTAAALAAGRVRSRLDAVHESGTRAVSVPGLLGVSRAIEEVRRTVVRAASAPFAVMIEGESGTGKELVARAIHGLSPRARARFCDLNCAALPDDLVESELFGHARGAFTGALAERAGLFEQAHAGTLFLDELPDLSQRAQAKLLRAIQQQEIRRVGEDFPRKVDVRLVTATNRPMAELVEDGRFRQDLLYRLDVVHVNMPPLRDRPADIAVLADHFWREAAGRTGSRATLSHGVYQVLSAHAWPGNVRELQNVLSALAVAAPSRGVVRASLLPAAMAGASAPPGVRLADARREFERRFVEAALARAGQSRTRTARDLGISRQGLARLVERLGLARSCRASSTSW
ncbi:MAG: AAA family ATPase [Acidimicrobiia bacterium]|nr:AAA family ATPase [Acidimicrobiia bacterium]